MPRVSTCLQPHCPKGGWMKYDLQVLVIMLVTLNILEKFTKFAKVSKKRLDNPVDNKASLC